MDNKERMTNVVKKKIGTKKLYFEILARHLKHLDVLNWLNTLSNKFK